MGLLIAAWLLVVASGLALYFYERELRKNKQLLLDKFRAERYLVAASQLDHKLPIGSRIYFDEKMQKQCRACGGGLMRRKRFRVLPTSEGERVLVESTGIFWCGDCTRRGLFQRDDA